MNDYSHIEEFARDLGIEQVPEFWKTHWQEFEEWMSSGGCGVKPGEIPPNAQEVFDLPAECMQDLRRVCATIAENPSLAKLANLWHFFLFHLPGERGLAEDIFPHPTRILGDDAPFSRIAALVAGTEHTLEAYERMGVQHEIVMDSLAQAGDQAREYYAKHGVYGMRFLGWTRNYFQASMFRIGRLVFNPGVHKPGFRVYRHRANGELVTLCAVEQSYRADGMADGTDGIRDPNAWTAIFEAGDECVRGNPVSPAGEAVREIIMLDARKWEPFIMPEDAVIQVHIPGHSSGGRMVWEDCVEAYHQAIEFFFRHYPDRRFKAFTCWSWLLDPSLAKILPPQSNIVKFQSPFHLLPVVSDAGGTYDWVFGDPSIDINSAPRKTSLQRAIVEYVSAGNHMRSVAGYMTIDEVKALRA